MKFFFIEIVTSFLLVCSSLSFSQPASNEQTRQFSQVNLIFLQNATSGELQESKRHPGYYRLTLNNINPYVTYFTQRPNRNSGIVPVQNFIKAWNVGPNNFANNHPNAVIIAGQINDATNKDTPPMIATLSSPQYDSNKNVLQFLAKPLSTQKLIYKDFEFQYVTLIIE